MWSWQASSPVQSVPGMDGNRFLIFRSLLSHIVSTRICTSLAKWRESGWILDLRRSDWVFPWLVPRKPGELWDPCCVSRRRSFSSLQHSASVCFLNGFLGYLTDIVQHYWSHGPSQLLYHHDGCSFSKISGVALWYLCAFSRLLPLSHEAHVHPESIPPAALHRLCSYCVISHRICCESPAGGNDKRRKRNQRFSLLSSNELPWAECPPHPPEGALTCPESWQNLNSLVPDLVFTCLGSFPVFAQELKYILRSVIVLLQYQADFSQKWRKLQMKM